MSASTPASMIHLNVDAQSSPKPRMQSAKKSPPGMTMPCGRSPTHGRQRSMRRDKAKRVRARSQNQKGSLRAKAHQGQLLPDLLKIRIPDPTASRPSTPNPNMKQDRAHLMNTCLQWCLPSPNLAGDMLRGIPWTTWSALLPSHGRSSLFSEISSLANGLSINTVRLPCSVTMRRT